MIMKLFEEDNSTMIAGQKFLFVFFSPIGPFAATEVVKTETWIDAKVALHKLKRLGLERKKGKKKLLKKQMPLR